MSDRKGLFVSYLLLIVGGIFGIHLVYLRRRKQAFIYATTLGWCGLGLVHDLFAIPRYVREANALSASHLGEPRVQQSKRKAKKCPLHTELTLRYFCVTCQKPTCGDCCVVGGCKGHSHVRIEEQSAYGVPPFRFGKFVVQVVYGALLGGICSCLVPEEVEELGVPDPVLKAASGMLAGLGAAFGCWLVGCIGKEKVGLLRPALAATIVGALPVVMGDANVSPFALSCLSAILISRGRSYDRSFPSGRNGFVALSLHTLSLLLFCAALFFAAYNYGTMETTPNEEEPDVKVRVKFRYMLKDIPWDQVFNLLASLDAERLAEFWASSTEQAMLEQSYELLGLTEEATLRELKKRFRTLSAKHHPDVYRGEDTKANEEFYFKIVEAFETIEAVQTNKRRD